jgi:hypothetical protein
VWKISFWNIFFLHRANLVITKVKIKFGEEMCSIVSSFKRSSIMTKMGNLPLIIKLLRAQKLGHMHQVPSFLRTMTIEEE